jgi:hypothetical protein
MKHTVRVLALSACTLFLAGCYTQLSMVQRAEAPPRLACPEGRADSCAQADSLAAATQGRTDTVVVGDDRSQTCYWTRNFWGDPVLRCYRSTYTSDWLSYYSDPWWNNRYGDDWGGYSSCPSYYYYDRYSGYCRNGHDYNNYWVPEGSHHATGGSSSGSSGAPHPRGYGVPGYSSQSGSGLTKTDAATHNPPQSSAPANRSDDRPSVAPHSRSSGVPSAPSSPAPALAAPKASGPQSSPPAGGGAMSGSSGGKQEGRAQGDDGKAGSSEASPDRSQPTQKPDNPDNSTRKNPRSW